MAEDVMVERQELKPREDKVAERFLRKKGIEKPEDPKKDEAPKDLSPLVGEAYDLLVERDELKADIVRKQRELTEPKKTGTLTLEQKMDLVRQGRIASLLSSPTLSYEEVVSLSQAKIEDMEGKIQKIFETPGAYDKFKEDLSRQVRVRQQAREAQGLDKFAEQTELLTVKLTREAQVQGNSLTSAERQILADNQKIKEEAQKRKQELLKDANVFDRVRLLELRDYQRELRDDRFAETPSRKAYLKKIEQAWAEGKKVLLTGETGTGKTETIKHASNKLFGVNPESVTGHQDMSIYELLGKTGFKVQVGDEFRPAPMVRAMTARDGRGLPFLFDEIDRAPNQSVMGIKTILNARPGEKGIKVQTDSAGSFDVGKDYAVSATANIKSEKYVTATELDPAIVRVFDAPMDIDYIPAHEVYDLALASLMDKRGGVPLSQEEASVILRNLCDAASWIQDSYQGRKVITDPSKGSFLEARGQAATGKSATLKKALLDPGRTLDMLKGWQGAKANNISFEDYLGQRIVDFINNRAYPEEDRYYLSEIFALKGFLRGRKASELLIPGLTQDILDTWAGGNKKVKSKSSGEDYIKAERVAALDPYKRFKRPKALEAEELLLEDKEKNEEAEVASGHDSLETKRASEILGKDFLGVFAVRNMEAKLRAAGQNVEFDLENIPPLEYSEKDLEIAKQNGEMLVLRAQTMLMDGREIPISMIDFRELFKNDPMNKLSSVFYSFRSGADDWYKSEKFATKPGEIKLGWALVKKDVLTGTTSKTWNDQEQILKQYEAGLKKKGAKNASVRRRTASEAVWDTMLYYSQGGEQLLERVYDWTQTRASVGYLVVVGFFDSGGLYVIGRFPEFSDGRLGVCPSR